MKLDFCKFAFKSLIVVELNDEFLVDEGRSIRLKTGYRDV